MSDDMLRLAELADQLDCERIAMAAAEQVLWGVQERVKNLTEVIIPELMDQLEIDHFKTRSGLEIEVADAVFASITEANREDALRWLEENGHGGMIKRAVVIGFNKGQEDEANGLVTRLAAANFAVKQDRSVNPMTLKAWARNRVQAGEEIPESISVHTARVAKIKK
jgi:hypothetical protein